MSGTDTIGIRILLPRIERKGLTRDGSIRGLTIPFAVGDSPKAVAISGLTASGDILAVQPTGASEAITTIARGSLQTPALKGLRLSLGRLLRYGAFSGLRRHHTQTGNLSCP